MVRRVRPTPGSQLALFTTWDYHAFVTNRPGDLGEIEADHRRHAVVEQRIAELKSAGLAHLPSGKFMANAAWLALAVMAHNLARAVGRLAGPDLEKATVEHPATTGLHRPGTSRAQRATPTSTTTGLLAMGIGNRSSADHDPGDPDCAADHHPPHRRPGPRRSRQTGGSRTPRSARTDPHSDSALRHRPQQVGRWILRSSTALPPLSLLHRHGSPNRRRRAGIGASYRDRDFCLQSTAVNPAGKIDDPLGERPTRGGASAGASTRDCDGCRDLEDSAHGTDGTQVAMRSVHRQA